MELHNDEVPASEVWAVVIENADVRSVDWFLTPEASSDAYRSAVGWYTRNAHEIELPVRVTRWYVELPRQRMDRYDVDWFVEGFISDPERAQIKYRLDVKKFSPTRKEVAP